MTTVAETVYKCPLCGFAHTTDCMTSTSAFGAPDLDGRPSPMARLTIYLFIKECPNCGFTSYGFPEHTSVSREFIQSDNYLNCDNIDFKTERAKLFYKVYLISKEEGLINRALTDLVHCAWVCDDDDDEENSIKLRLLINDLFNELYDFKSDEEDYAHLIKLDFMRRGHLFDELIEEVRHKTFSKSFYNKVKDFQMEKAKNRDAGKYTFDDIEGYEEYKYG